MHTPAQSSAETARQSSLSAPSRAPRTDLRAEMDSLKTLSTTMGASPSQQDLQARQAMMHSGALQRKVRYERVGKDRYQDVYRKLALLAAEMEVEEIPLDDVTRCLTEIEQSPLDYGVYDLADQQHQIYLYFDILKRLAGDTRQTPGAETVAEQESATESEQRQRREARAKLERLPELANQKLYEIAYLGAGASIAYDIVSRGTDFDAGDGIVIGTLQPWAGVRGPGVVAHPENMISPIRHFLGLEAIDDTWQDRGEFSALVAQVFERAKLQPVEQTVSKIEQKAYGYLITTKEGDTYRTRKIVSGIGVGEHRPPDGVGESRIARNAGEVARPRQGDDPALGALKIMSMDVFTQIAHRLRKTKRGKVELVKEGAKVPRRERERIKVVLSGANGGIDVAFDALNRGFQVEWIVGNGGATFLSGFPNYAAYLPYLHALNDSNELGRIKVDNYKAEVARVQKLLPGLYKDQSPEIFADVIKTFNDARFAGVYFGRLSGVEEVGGQVKATVPDKAPILGDLLVYAQGQGDGNFGLFKDLPELKPQRDRNHRFTEGGDAVLGLASEDGSLRVVGAMAYRMAAARDTNYDQMKVASHGLRGLMPLPAAEFVSAHELFEALMPLVRDAQRDAGIVAGRRRAKAPRTELEPLEKNAAASAKARKEGLEKFEKAMLAVNGKFAELARQKLLARKRRYYNSLQGHFADAVASTGTVGAAMRPVIDTLPKDVLLNDQLTATRSQVEALREFVPFNTGAKANFITDDRTVLAIHLAARYPLLADMESDFVEKVAEAIVGGRRKKRQDTLQVGVLRFGRPNFTAEPPNGKRYQRFWEAKLQAVQNHHTKK